MQLSTMPLDKIQGQPTNTTVNHLIKQIARMTAAVKTTQWGGRHGCLLLVVDDIEYQRITNNAGATTERQPKPGTTPEGLTNQTTLINRTRILGLHKIVTKDYYKQESTDSIIVERVVTEAVDEIYVEELEDEYIGYSNQTIKSLIQHLKDEWCIVTTLEKKRALTAFHLTWNWTRHITGLAKELDRQQKNCRDVKVEAGDATKVQIYVENMYASELFDETELQPWENKLPANKTWVNVKGYFVPLYKSKAHFKDERATRHGVYKSGNPVSARTTFNSSGASVISHGSTKPPTNITTGTMSQSDQQTMIEYTNSLKGALDNVKEHTATLASA